MNELTVGFVGLGNMGWPMAANLRTGSSAPASSAPGTR